MEEYVVPESVILQYDETDETFEKSNDDGFQFDFHKHPLFSTDDSSNACVGCGEVRVDPTGGYACDRRLCKKVYVHKGCLKITNHDTHPLYLTAYDKHKKTKCSVCEVPLEPVDRPDILYIKGSNTFVADFNDYGYCYPFSGDICVCRACARKEPYIYDTKSHEHRLFVLLKGFFSFPCDACGLTNDSSCLCMCIPCRFTIHRHCANLPRVICINRHNNHRIYHVPRLVYGDCSCGVCHETIDSRYGAYSCFTCYFNCHSKCATRRDVWDGKDLEGEPEEVIEDPFQVIQQGVIKHFSHEHNLRFITKDDIGHVKYKQCYACVLPIFSDPCYICIHCDFILHETCAYLPRKIRHMSHQKQFTLYSETRGAYGIEPFRCSVCTQMCNGFSYMVDDFRIDVRCVLIYDGFVHKIQPDSMVLAPVVKVLGQHLILEMRSCLNCEYFMDPTLRFSGHDDLCICYKCVTMPAQVTYKYDDHLLSLRFSEIATGDYWCEICETKVGSHKWFYTCDECCTSVHINCVLGIQPYLRVGSTFMHKDSEPEVEVEVVRNNFASRPSCVACSSPSRIVDALVFKSKDQFFCLKHSVSF